MDCNNNFTTYLVLISKVSFLEEIEKPAVKEQLLFRADLTELAKKPNYMPRVKKRAKQQASC